MLRLEYRAGFNSGAVLDKRLGWPLSLIVGVTEALFAVSVSATLDGRMNGILVITHQDSPETNKCWQKRRDCFKRNNTPRDGEQAGNTLSEAGG